jgi:DNA-binding transcriptional LysR family regulator
VLDVRRLRVLRELAARGTIAATADALGYTAPAVSQQLAALEREAGVDLLERTGRRRRLTPAGEELVVRTESILRELEAAEAALERTTTHVAGVLRCAAFASAQRALLPRAIAALATRHPELRVTTRDLEAEESVPALKLGELDLALAQDYSFAPNPKDPAIERTDLLEDVIRVALPADHPLADHPKVDIAALEPESWISHAPGTFCHRLIAHSTGQAGYEPKIMHVTNDFQVSFALVAARAGVTLVPDLAGPPPPGVVVRPVAGAPRFRRIYAAVRAGSADRPAIAAMLEELVRQPSKV